MLGDFDLAEEAVQDAFVRALEVWPERGAARQPGRLDHDRRPQPGAGPHPAGARLEDKVRELEQLVPEAHEDDVLVPTAPSPTTGCG